MSAIPKLEKIYTCFLECYGPQHWWPADEPFEVILGAILTQSTAWTNVEKAIANLKRASVLNPAALREISVDQLAELIRPSGYYNVKARKVKAILDHMLKYDDSLEKMFEPEIIQLRSELLSIYGIGEETADSIILYAAEKPIFVIDAYTQRIMARLGLNPGYSNYALLQGVFMKELPPDTKLFNEYHALFVRHGKERCKKNNPICEGCGVQGICFFGQG